MTILFFEGMFYDHLFSVSREKKIQFLNIIKFSCR